jgi:fatty-acyl-CoA synthase
LFWGAEADEEYEALIRSSDAMPARSDMQADDVVHILFTSGSTAAPKAATGTLGALVWQAFNQAEASRVAERGAHVLTPLPLFHAGGLNSLTNPILFFGGRVTISARFDPEAVAGYLGDPANGVTHIALVPLMYSLIAASPSFARGDFSALKVAILAGGRLTGELQSTWAAKAVAFSPQYGGTETGPSVTALAPARQDKARAGSCGTAVMHVEVKLVGDDGEEVPVGAAGEIWVRGPAITRGYLGRERELDYSGDWFRTGDVAHVDDEGFYYIVDRKKDMYKSGGENVSPAEVEEVLADHPDIAEVAVIGVAHEKWGETGLAVVVVRNGSAPGLDDLRQHCEGRLARYKQPHRLEIVDQLPRNVTGKISKEELRARFGGTATA